MWYRLTAHNEQTLFGWTQDPAVAEAALRSLNCDRPTIMRLALASIDSAIPDEQEPS